MIITIIPNRIKSQTDPLAQTIAARLTAAGATVRMVEDPALPSQQELAAFLAGSDAVIAIGGDGTILRCARRAAISGVPVTGINLGRLGYLAELEPSELELLCAVLDGKGKREKRMMLSCEIHKLDKSVISASHSLNDIVLTSTGNTTRLIDIELSLADSDSLAVCYRGDGVVVSTPTGSTAYSLAAGGPIVDPSLEGISIVPICPHSLTSRPMMFSSDKRLKLINNGRENANVSADGCEEYILEPGEYIICTSSEYSSVFERIHESTFYEQLKKKMYE